METEQGSFICKDTPEVKLLKFEQRHQFSQFKTLASDESFQILAVPLFELLRDNILIEPHGTVQTIESDGRQLLVPQKRILSSITS